ncbi:hypothetical protein, partial [Mycobacterium mantenii]|uniref:hypothetical protein n=1 Tax=Mycobacterium mantenii TaxID=560555 RepID=UPI0009ECC83F
MKIREVIAGSILVGSLGGGALGLGAGFAAAEPAPPPPPPPPPPPLVWSPRWNGTAASTRSRRRRCR